MRGKVSLPRLAKGGIGITPAYAGKSGFRDFYKIVG